MAQNVIRLSQLATTSKRVGKLPVSPATIWRWVKQGSFPSPFKLAKQTTVWDADQVQAWLDAQKEAAK